MGGIVGAGIGAIAGGRGAAISSAELHIGTWRHWLTSAIKSPRTTWLRRQAKMDPLAMIVRAR